MIFLLSRLVIDSKECMVLVLNLGPYVKTVEEEEQIHLKVSYNLFSCAHCSGGC